MKEIDIRIDPGSPVRSELEIGLKTNLDAFKTVRFRTTTIQVAPGTLTGAPEQIVGFVIENYRELIPLVTALILLVKQILKNSDKKNQVILEIGADKLGLPASEKAQRTFLRNLQTKNSEGKNKQKKTKAKKKKN